MPMSTSGRLPNDNDDDDDDNSHKELNYYFILLQSLKYRYQINQVKFYEQS